MTEDNPPAQSDDAPRTGDAADGRAPFARLVEELAELAYEPSTDDATATVTYTATDSTMKVVLDRGSQPPGAVLADTGVDRLADWDITFTAATPDEIQIVILYAAMNPDHPAEGIEAAAASLGAAIQP
jgi:hypothetical protein